MVAVTDVPKGRLAASFVTEVLVQTTDSNYPLGQSVVKGLKVPEVQNLVRKNVSFSLFIIIIITICITYLALMARKGKKCTVHNYRTFGTIRRFFM